MRARSQSSQPSQSRPTGIRPRGGFHRLCAYIATKARGTRTLATATTAGSNSFRVRGPAWVVAYGPTGQVHANSFIERGGYIYVTVEVGASGALRPSADFGEAWVRANREALGYDR